MGGARCDITPPVGIYHRMWGAATHDTSTGIHRRLTATALVFQSLTGEAGDDSEQILLAVDHCLLWHREMDYVLDCIAEGAGVSRQRIVVTFSHTHAAGLMDIERAALPGGDLIQPYLEELAARLATCVRQARETVQPVTIAYGLGRCNLAMQRDFFDEASGQYVCGPNPTAAADDTLLVARVSDEQNAAVATIVNYACHPTTLAWANTLISSDFPGAMREMVEESTSAPCVFLQGASGDLGPREGYVGDVAVADRNGRILGHAVLSVLEALPAPGTTFEYVGPVVSGATLGDWSHRPLDDVEQGPLAYFRVKRLAVDLDKRPDLSTPAQTIAERDTWREKESQAQAEGDSAAARDARAMIERLDRQLVRLAAMPPGTTFALPVTIWQMGPAYWITVEGEPYNVLQKALRGRFPGVPMVVSVLANGSRPFYLPPAGVYGRGIYQEEVAMLAPGTLERLIDAISNQLAGWQREWPAIQQRLGAPDELLPVEDDMDETAEPEMTTAFQGFPEGRVD